MDGVVRGMDRKTTTSVDSSCFFFSFSVGGGYAEIVKSMLLGYLCLEIVRVFNTSTAYLRAEMDLSMHSAWMRTLAYL